MSKPLTALVLCTLFAGGAGLRAGDEAKEKATAEEIKKLVGQLGAAGKDDRTRAEKRLVEIGAPALAALREAAFQNKDKALAKTARGVVTQIAARAQKALAERLTKRKAKNYVLRRVGGDAAARALPANLVFAVRFSHYPVAVRPPAPLRLNNLFILEKDGQWQHVYDFQGLHAFCKDNLGRVLKEEDARNVARAWLEMSQELIQDGYYKFSIPEDDIKVDSTKTGLKVTARAVVKPEMGNKGRLQVEAEFEMTGTLDSLKQDNKLVRGIRPRCQATKLLDPDPIVRAMAEQDILVMGRAAKAYLREQRAKAGPDLRKAIDRIWRQIVAEGR
jgi:hypothetical protein